MNSTHRHCCRAVRARRSGFTAIELLVSLAVIAILLSLLLPAVQSSREQARRVQCISQLRQLGAATQSYVGVHNKYPGVQRSSFDVGGTSIPPAPMPPPVPRESIHARLLPFLEQNDLYNQLDPRNRGQDLAEPPVAEDNAFALAVDVPVFKCPSDRVPFGGNSYRGCLGPTTGLHGTYSSKQPLTGTIDMEGMAGIFQSEFRPPQIRDGLSHCVLFSERVVGDGNSDEYTPFRDLAGLTGMDFYRPNDAVVGCAGFTTADGYYSQLGYTWVLPRYAHTAYNHVLAPNSKIPDCMHSASTHSFSQGAMTARSLHPGGVNAVFADGAARFISESIDLKVWRAIGSITGGEVYGGY